MSNLTIAHLIADYGFEQTHSVHHNRSDYFISYFLDKNRQFVPYEYWQKILSYKPASEQEARQFLLNQYPDGIGFHDLRHKKREGKTFFNDLDEMTIDVILMDNFMDVGAKLVYSRLDDERGKSPIFLNHGFYSNEAELGDEYWHTEYLSPAESAKNWLRIYKWLREKQPHAKIFFLPYHSCTSQGHPDRFARAHNFYCEFEPMVRDEDLFMVPPLELQPELTKGEVDWPHFIAPLYRALAGYVFLHTVAGLPKPRQHTNISKVKIST